LIVTDDHVELLDFKTGRRVPDDAFGISTAFARQMAHYVGALQVIFPGRSVSAALLYTHGAKLIELPGDLLAPHIPTT